MVQLTNPADHSPGKGKGKPGFSKQLLTTCKVCLCGVYEGEAWKFYRQPTGISHTDCVERQGAQ